MDIKRIKVIEPRNLWWESRGVFNPAVVEYYKKIYMLYRAVGKENISRFGLAVSEDGENFSRLDTPVLEGNPENGYERLGIEDPRTVMIGKEIYITYTAASIYPADSKVALSPDRDQSRVPWRIRISAAKTRDFQHFNPLGIWLNDFDSKDGALFNRKIQDRYWLLHRMQPSIYITSSPTLGHWQGGLQLMEPKQPWEEMKIGAACPPIELDEGWLFIYHGVDRRMVYSMGAALLAKENPCVVLKRAQNPFMRPETHWEKNGFVNNVVFITGAIRKGEELWFYYGAADTAIGLAKVKISDILEQLDL